MEGLFEIQSTLCESMKMVPVKPAVIKKNIKYKPDRSFFRPYEIKIENGKVAYVFHDQKKTGFIKESGFHVFSCGGDIYYYYHVGYGKKGIVAPIYKGEMKIATIYKSASVTDDLHVFSAEIADKDDVSAVLALMCYSYVITYYKAGEKCIKGVKKNVVTTKDKFLLSK